MPVIDSHGNFAYSTVATAPSPATTGMSLVVQTGDGAKFPTPPFNVTFWPASSQPTTANAEIARVTAVATDTLTLVRAQEGSTARSVVVGDQIAATITTKTLTDIEQFLAAPNIWKTLFLRDDFAGGNNSNGQWGELGWRAATGAGASFAATNAVANHPGIINLATGTTASVYAELILGIFGGTNTFHFAGDQYDMVWIARLNTTTNVVCRLGWTASPGYLDPGGYCAIEFDTGQADTTWHAVNNSAGGKNRVDLTKAVDTNWHLFRIRYDGTNILFSMDGGTEYTNNTDFPSADLWPQAEIGNRAAANATLDVDFFAINSAAQLVRF